MSRYALIKDGVVENVIEADQSFVDSVMSPMGYTCNVVNDGVRCSPGFSYTGSSYLEPTTTRIEYAAGAVTITITFGAIGSVDLYDSNRGSVVATVAIAGDVAVWIPAPGDYNIQATFSGDGYVNSQSNSLSFSL